MTPNFHYHSKFDIKNASAFFIFKKSLEDFFKAKKTLEHYNKYATKILEMIRKRKPKQKLEKR